MKIIGRVIGIFVIVESLILVSSYYLLNEMMTEYHVDPAFPRKPWSLSNIFRPEPLLITALVSACFASIVFISTFTGRTIPESKASIFWFALGSSVSGYAFVFLLGPQTGFIVAIVASQTAVWLIYAIFFQKKTLSADDADPENRSA